MPWKDRYTISDEKSLLDSEVSWPSWKAAPAMPTLSSWS